MRNLKKLLCALLAIIMIVSVFAGCTQEEKPAADGTKPAEVQKEETPEKEVASEPIVLKFWGGVPEERGPADVVARFNEEYKDKGISVVYERFVNDDSGNLKLNTALLSGEDVDLYMSYSVPAYVKRVESGMATDLTPYIERDGFDMNANFGSMAEAYTVDGKAYCMPTYSYKYCFMP